MALSDFWRGGRERPDRDDNRGREMRSRDESRNFGRPNYPRDEGGIERRGWRPGSDYYGDNPERYAAGRSGAARSQGEDQRNRGDYREEHRGGYRGSEDDWSRRANRDRGGYGYTRGGPSFNDRWQNAYNEAGEYAREPFGQRFGRSSEYDWDYAAQDRDSERWSNELAGRSGEAGSRAYSQAESFRGRGPRGYRRSDERIREDVCECLTDDERIDATNIQVAVKECEVTLTGAVNSREEKRRAEDLIERLSGVKDVHNTLRVVNEGGLIEGGTTRNEQTGTASGSQSNQTSSRH